MAGVKISNLPVATTPLAGTESIPIVQSGVTVRATAVNVGAVASYTPNGLGAVVTTVQTKLRESVSVKDFGAVGDGVTDDTVAVQAFLNACKNGRGYLPSGRYKITSALTIDPKFSYNIEGAAWDNSNNGGGATTIYNAGTGHAIQIFNTPYVQNYDKEIRLANLTIEGNASSQHGIYVLQAIVQFENIWVTTNGFHGVLLEKAYGSCFKQCIFTGNYRHGAAISSQGNAIVFDHCVFNGNSRTDGYSGCAITGSTGFENLAVTFISCDFTGNGASVTNAYGISIQHSRGVNLVGCYFEGNKLRNLYSDVTTYGLNVVGSYFQDGTQEIIQPGSLLYQNNHHAYVAATTSTIITAGDRVNYKINGNTYVGGATSTLTYCKDRAETFDTAIPAGGSWVQGDIVWHNSPSTGGNIGWVCTVSGTPGTWKAFGTIA